MSDTKAPQTEKWYRRTTWSPEIERQFRDRNARSRGDWSRAQYLAVQAAELVRAGFARDGIRLSREVLDTYPDEKGRWSPCWNTIADGHWSLGERQEAFEALRHAIDSEVRFPHCRCGSGRKLAFLLVTNGIPWDIGDVERALLHDDRPEQEDMFPSVRFECAVVRAAIAKARGDMAAAARHAITGSEAMRCTKSGVARHPTVCLVKDVPKGALDIITSILHSTPRGADG